MAAPAEAQQEIDDAGPEPAPAPEPAEPAAKVPTAGPPGSTRNWRHAVASQAAAVSSKLTPLAQHAGDRVAAASPMTLVVALLGLLATLFVVAALSLDNALGVASTVLFVPAISAAVGAVALRCVDDRRTDHDQRANADREASQLRRAETTLAYVDSKLTSALTEFGSERHNEAVIAMFQAKAVSELYLGSDREQTPELTADAAQRSALVPSPAPKAVRNSERSERPSGLSLI